MRLIDADAFKNYIRNALDEVRHLYKDGGAWAEEITESFCRDIDEQPTIEERKTGKWIDRRYKIGYHCSECGGYVASGKENFCPYCGAKMECGKRSEYDEFVLCDAKMEGEQE